MNTFVIQRTIHDKLFKVQRWQPFCTYHRESEVPIALRFYWKIHCLTLVNSTSDLMWKQSDITRIAKGNECDISFSQEIWQQIHSPGSEFFLNRQLKVNSIYRAKAKIFVFLWAVPVQKPENPFKGSCKYLVNRKQDILEWKPLLF